MTGIPGSGKSTFAQSLAEALDFEIVCLDTIRGELYGDERIQGNGNEVFQCGLERMKLIGSRNGNCIYDATNIKSARRKALIDMLKEHYFAEIECVVMPAPLEVCLERNEQRERKVPRSVIRRMHEQFEYPTEEEGFDYIIDSYTKTFRKPM
jgi:predicted kinase